MSDMDISVLIARWLHIVAAIVALGGAAFVRFALLPACTATLDESTHARLREVVAARWSRVVHGAIGVLLVTGGFNFVRLAMSPDVEPMPYHAIFGLKFMLALLIFVIATALVGRSAGFAGVRENARRWLSVLLALGAVVVLLSGSLHQVRTARTPAADSLVASPEQR
jgi:uncharacterized membrane protein